MTTNLEATFSLSREEFIKYISDIKHAAGKKDVRVFLNTIIFNYIAAEDKLTIAASNGHHLLVNEIKSLVRNEKDFSFFVPIKLIEEISKEIKKNKAITNIVFNLYSSLIKIICINNFKEEIKAYEDLLLDNYHNSFFNSVKQIIKDSLADVSCNIILKDSSLLLPPKDLTKTPKDKGILFCVNKEDFINIKIIEFKEHIKVVYSKDIYDVTISNSLREFISIKGKSFKFMLNLNYFISAMNNLDSKQISISVQSKFDPLSYSHVLINSSESNSFSIIAPLSLHNVEEI